MSLFNSNKNLLAIYFTAGYPKLEDTTIILKTLDKGNVDLIEVGMPYSDPLADGNTIQETSRIALENGMNIELLFNQLASVKDQIKTPIFIMGYYNQFLQFGPELFLIKCKETGVKGLILPDLPVEYYTIHYQELFEKYNIKISFLITPNTKEDRIQTLSNASSGFLYIVSSSSTTGSKEGISDEQIAFFNKINQLKINNTQLIGFGISNQESFYKASEYANGAIIGSAFLNALKGINLELEVSNFIKAIK
ncbi:MAG: tryptophan synthase subunit alpha [Solirubrobacteraceae bacterium]